MRRPAHRNSVYPFMGTRTLCLVQLDRQPRHLTRRGGPNEATFWADIARPLLLFRV